MVRCFEALRRVGVVGGFYLWVAWCGAQARDDAPERLTAREQMITRLHACGVWPLGSAALGDVSPESGWYERGGDDGCLLACHAGASCAELRAAHGISDEAGGAVLEACLRGCDVDDDGWSPIADASAVYAWRSEPADPSAACGDEPRAGARREPGRSDAGPEGRRLRATTARRASPAALR